MCSVCVQQATRRPRPGAEVWCSCGSGAARSLLFLSRATLDARVGATRRGVLAEVELVEAEAQLVEAEAIEAS